MTARRGLLLLAAYLAVAVVATWPLAPQAADHVVGDEAAQGMCVGTPNLNVWAMGAVLHQLPRDPLGLFDANAFYPYSRSLAFSEHLFVPALMAAPVLLATGNLVLAYNVTALLTLALAGLGMYLLARELVGDGVGAFAAGLLYAFHSFNLNELLRLQILSNQWFPFVVLALVRYFDAPSRRRALAVFAFYTLQSLSCMYWLLYLPFVVAPVALVLLLRRRPAPRALVALAIALGAALALSALFAWPYLENQRAFGFERTGVASMPIDRYLRVLPGSWLYTATLASAGPNEHAPHFLGFVAMALALFGVLRLRSAREPLRRLAPALGFLVVFGFAASLGPEMELGPFSIPGPYAFLRAFVPGFAGSRYPERFSILLVLGLGPFLALGLQGLARFRLFATLLAALVVIEHCATPLELAYLPGRIERIPAVYRWLAQQDDVKVVAEVPTSHYYGERSDGIPMYLSTFHWKRIVQGYTGYFPPAYHLLKWALYSFPTTGDASLLAEAGVDTLVVGPGAVPEALLARGAWTRVGPFDGGHVVLRLKRDPQARIASAAGFEPIPRDHWRVSASSAGATNALDGDAKTAWSDEAPRAQPYFRVEFRDTVRVKRIRLGVRTGQWAFLTRFDVRGIVAGRELVDLPLDKPASYNGLLHSILETPLQASMVIELPPTELRGLLIRQARRDPFRLPWSIAEIDVEAAR